MKHNFPQVDLPVEMLAWRDVTEDILNLYRQSCRLKACIFALCTEGTIKASINLMEYEIKKNDLIILMPGTIIQLNEQKEKVRSVLWVSPLTVSTASICYKLLWAHSPKYGTIRLSM